MGWEIKGAISFNPRLNSYSFRRKIAVILRLVTDSTHRLTILIVAFCALVSFLTVDLHAQAGLLGEASGGNIDIESDETDYDHDNGVATARGNVYIQYGGTEIFAGKAEYHISTGDIHAEDNVSIYQGGLAYKGDAAIYNINTGKITANHLRSGMSPLFYDSGSIDTELDKMDKISMKSSVFTTHDSANPNYKIKAKEIEIVGLDGPEHKQRIIFKNMTVYAGSMPVFWLPYLSQPLDAEQGYHFLPGYRSNWGAFLLNSYGLMIGDHTLATARLDFRSARGVAGGLDLQSMRHRDNPNFGKFTSYYAYDTDTSQTHTNRTREEAIDENRYRVNFQHRIYLPGPEESTLYLDFDINKISDAFFYQDFFPNEYRIDPEPDNLVNLQKVFPRGTASLWARFRPNNFYRTDSRLPEFALDFTTSPIGRTGLYYTGETSAGIYEEKLGTVERDRMLADIEKLEAKLAGTLESLPPGSEPDRIRDLTVVEAESLLGELRALVDGDTGFNRFDTYHQISMPKTLFGWLNLTPRLGGRATAYGDVSGDASSDTRTALHAGLDASFKVSKNYANARLPRLGVDGVRHIVQPYINYSFVAANSTDPAIGKIDRLVPSTQLRPLDLSQYTAIDSITDWNIIRTGVNQRFQTQRDGAAYNWLELDTYFETYIDDPEYDRDLSNLYADLDFRPVPWMAVGVGAQFPMGTSPWDYSEYNTRVAFMPNDTFEFTVTHRYLQDHPLFENSNLLDLRAYVRLGDRWGLSARQRYEFDDGTLEFQQYSVHYDLNSWTAGLGAIIADHRSGEDEYGIVLTLTLKDFPSLSVPIGLTPTGS